MTNPVEYRSGRPAMALVVAVMSLSLVGDRLAQAAAFFKRRLACPGGKAA